MAGLVYFLSIKFPANFTKLSLISLNIGEIGGE